MVTRGRGGRKRRRVNGKQEAAAVRSVLSCRCVLPLPYLFPVSRFQSPASAAAASHALSEPPASSFTFPCGGESPCQRAAAFPVSRFPFLLEILPRLPPPVRPVVAAVRSPVVQM